jgi:tRNA(Ile)-lysidine synthase
MELHHPSLDLAKMSIEPTALTTELQARVRTSYQFASQKNIEPSSCRGSSITPKNLQIFGDPVINNGKEIIPKKSDIVKKFQNNMANFDLTTKDAIVVGVSGGVDSVVLLNLLNFLETKIKPKLIVAHLNHGYREDSDNDEIFVSKLAANFGLKFVSKKLDRHSNILQNVGMSSNLEEYFRDERRAFLEEVAKNHKAKYICLGHNAVDQAETVIMNLVRGSGPAGLGGMHMSEGKIIRPILNISRSEIESYAIQNSIKWHEDSTNQDTAFDRNYTRHHILPLLSRLNLEFLESISRSAWIQRRVDEMLKSEANKILDEFKDDVKSGQNLPKPLLYEVFGQMYEKVKGDRKNLDLKNLQRLENLIKKTSGTNEVSLPSGIVARRSYAKLDFLPRMRDNKVPPKQTVILGKNTFGEWQIKTKIAEYSKNDDKYICFLPDLNNLTVRTMVPGDQIKLLGTGGTKKLQDIFTDAKIDREKRRNWPVFEHSGEIIWVPGLAYTNIDLKKKNIIKITVQGKKNEENSENPQEK